MVEVNGAYKQGRYEKTGLKSLWVMSNVNVLPYKTDTTHYGQMNTTNYTEPYDSL